MRRVPGSIIKLSTHSVTEFPISTGVIPGPDTADSPAQAL